MPIVHNPDNLPTMPIKDMKPLQGNLKTLSDDNYELLKSSIETHGFFVPIFIWQGMILDGHGRQKVMVNEGWGETLVPYVNIEADNIDDAKEKLLHVTSQYQRITKTGLDEFMPEWEELPIFFDAIDTDGWGDDVSEDKEVIEDEAPEVSKEEARSELGKVYQLGRHIYKEFPSDGKYILHGKDLLVCQSNASDDSIVNLVAELGEDYNITINPLGYWTGGTEVDTGATNRKLGSDMGRAVTGGGLHGKDLTKADVSLNIYAHLMAQDTGRDKELYCAIGQEKVDGMHYTEIMDIARTYIKSVGGFEKFAEWGLV